MIRNGRVALAGVLLLVASGLFGLTIVRPAFGFPVVAGAVVLVLAAFVTLFGRTLRDPRPA